MSMDPDPNRPENAPAYGSTYATPPAAPATPPGPPAPASGTNGFAIASLVLGIFGIVGFPPLLGSLLALIFGYKGKREIDRSGGVQQGRGLAVAGIVLGWVGFVFLVVGIIAIVGVFVFSAGGSSSGSDSFFRIGP